MLTRLKVNGFKNLVDVDVRFGPFTCLAGVNGSGKSNLFDAIRFLAALAEKPLVEAAQSVRGGRRSVDIADLFHKVGDQSAREMSLEAEMVIPAKGVDDIGQSLKASSLLLRYKISFLRRSDEDEARLPLGRIVIREESLSSIALIEAGDVLRFAYDKDWLDAVIHSNREEKAQTFISTHRDETNPQGLVRLIPESHADTDFRPEALSVAVAPLMMRTLLSAATSGWSPTVALARQEMQSWRVLQFEPAAMRAPDDFTNLLGPTQLEENGSRIAAALYSIAHTPPPDGTAPEDWEAAVYARVRNRLYQLLGEMRDIAVERDDKREELTLYATGRDGTTLPARALSDGTLRFLALAVLEQQQAPGLFCIEEPENGIHPGRIQALLDLLQAIAMDTAYPIGEGNPLRQVIISTHAPSVVMRVPESSLVVADLRKAMRDGKRFHRASFSGLAGTWRIAVDEVGIALGTLLSYLNPDGYRPLPEPSDRPRSMSERRLTERPDIRDLLAPTPLDA